MESIEAESNKFRDCHCVFYSFSQSTKLLKNPKNCIILSQGTTFVQAPFDLKKLNIPDMACDKAQLDKLRYYAKIDFELPDERHNWANWWGVKVLLDIHRLIIPNTSFQYPQKIIQKFKILETWQSIYLYDANLNKEKINDDLLNAIHEYRSIIASKKPKILHIDDEWDNGWAEIFVHILYEDSNSNVPRISMRSQDINKPFLNYIIDNIPVFRSLKINDTTKISKRNLDEFLDDLILKIEKILEKTLDINIILLDLRLLDEIGPAINVETLSGALLLNKLRKKFKAIPVIVTTASNKVWSLEGVIRLGIEGYWTKQGMDEQRSFEESANNYARLLELVVKAIDDQYIFLQKLEESIIKIKVNDSWWWQEQKWENNDITSARKKEIIHILEDSLILYRNYLQQFHMGYGILEKIQDNNFICSIIRLLSNILEEIHRFDLVESKRANSGLIGGFFHSGKLAETNRGDWLGFRLYDFRNKASHLKNSKYLGREAMYHFVSSLIKYLITGPDPKCFNEVYWKNCQKRNISKLGLNSDKF